jgi:dihydrofolate reductase/thymidylate synthase
MTEFNLIVSINQNNLIGIDNNLLITSKDDLKNFYKITTKKYPEGPMNHLIMGYNTWISIPEDRRPLKNRMNLILTRNHQEEITESETVKVFSELDDCLSWCEQNQTGKIFVIGGESIYQQCLMYKDQINIIYLTQFVEDYRCSRKNTKIFPKEILKDTDLICETILDLSDCEVYSGGNYIKEKMKIHFQTYQSKIHQNRGEYQYLKMLTKIKEEGLLITTRNGNTKSLFGEKMEFDMKDGFPLLTTKKMGYKTILRELLWFIRGSTSNQELQDRNVHIWDKNSTREFLDSRSLDYEEGDLGPVYGFQWRHSGAEYIDSTTDYSGLGVDQLQNVIELIKTDPHSRRIIMNSWNPKDLDKMALPPCHVMCQFNVNSRLNTLNCQLYQRSGDMFLGVPFNIASYSFLLHILSKITGYIPGKLIHILGDTHIYEEHFDAVNEQLLNIPYSFPELELSDELRDIDSLDESMFTIKNYKSYEKITAPMIA